jgi:predicted mannosyl-3-phosphoglycerate phosphatase (HAD superfamily)
MAGHFVIFTDLDGTLLDAETYSFQAARPALQGLKKKQVPVVFCNQQDQSRNRSHSQKTWFETSFIVENGGAIFIPPGYFTPEQLRNSGYKASRKGRLSGRSAWSSLSPVEAVFG